MPRFPFIAVYLMASKRNGTLYLGVTTNLPARAHQHRERLIEGFSQKYGCTILVWFEQHSQLTVAVAREKEIKKWRRSWKLELIEKSNPQWRDLYEDFINPPPPTFIQRPSLVIPGRRKAANPEPRE
jgi:putative endonuclease